MSDIVNELRDRAYSGKVPDSLSERAADEIERLRSRVRFCDNVIRSGDVAALTEDEQEAIRMARSIMAVEHDLSVGEEANGRQPRKPPVYWWGLSSALRSLLERLGGNRPQPVDIALRNNLRLCRDTVEQLQAEKAADFKAACESAELASKEITRLRLTDEEREAISAAGCCCEDSGLTDIAVRVNGLLERLK